MLLRSRPLNPWNPLALAGWGLSAWFVPAATAAAPATLLPAGVHRVVFIGDSITHAGFYVSDLVAYLRVREPNREIEVLNLGLPSETVSGLSEPGHAEGRFPRPDLRERLPRVLAQTRPDLVIACYGMNDGIYLPFDAGRFQAFQDGMRWLHQTVEASGAKIIHLTPPVYDETKGRFPVYADVVRQHADWIVRQRAEGWQVIDLHTAMRRELAERRTRQPGFAFSSDGVHPDPQGHWFMARVFLNGLGASGVEALATPEALLPGPNGAELLRLVTQQQAILRDAWLTQTGHRRPLAAGLPLPEAERQARELDTAIRKILTPAP
jgi:lysophospholipase L1-like esterase